MAVECELKILVFGECSEDVTINIDALDLVFAEDLTRHCAKRAEIVPLFSYLCGIYHDGSKNWLAPNQKLADWPETRSFQFRVRFKPGSLDLLKVRYFYAMMKRDSRV